jgi:hypothetical protein
MDKEELTLEERIKILNSTNIFEQYIRLDDVLEWFGFTKEQEMGSLLNENKIPKYRNELTKEQLEIINQNKDK